MTISKADMSGTSLAAAHVGDAVTSAVVALANEQADGEELALRTEVTALQTLNGDAGSTWLKIAVGAGTTAEVDSAVDLPDHCLVHEVVVEVVDPEVTGATKTLDIGILSSESGGDANGFIDGISVASAGLKRPVFAATVGSNNDYLGAAATHTIGAMLTGLLIEGEDTAAGGDGFALQAPFASDSITGKSISYSRGATFVEFTGFIWIRYSELVG